MDFSNPYATVDVALIDLIRNLGVGLIMALIWATVIGKTTRLVVDTRQYLPVFLLLIPSMILIITIIKSSIALSLGLVGALSIVRFRTPIKEPEELLYLFVAIAIGLGLGANQLLATFVGFLAICLAMIPFAFTKVKKRAGKSVFLDIVQSGKEQFNLNAIESSLAEAGLKYNIKRIDAHDGGGEVLIEVANFKMASFSQIQEALLKVDSGIKIIATENARVIT